MSNRGQAMIPKEIEEEMRSSAMSIVNAFDLEFDDADLQNFYAMLVGCFLHYFKAGAKLQYQKDREEFAKLKAKEWCNGYDDAISQFVKIPYKPTDWYLTDEEYMCGAQFDEPIPADAELYYRTK